ncbi:exodeoxyribonuclease III [Rickettsiales endosymbiont of Peranema trichophorum]|uniref:exodeoxyribonuclease III n=1 Tax=Rickettsiales endosymbiont of Peranema trichophorum TaxID=2486577 RepID=UPI001023BD5B|nr:exodeoxyribonuclease III [Rickettsiales endosymbiont of Peranema trichophorum]RZI47416.1 exodeoxyribonuclease III [Rickettsiales endosymbiont of Peranema trichophorum]
MAVLSMKQISVSTWNVNSIRSRLTHLVTFLNEYAPDVVLLQETKCQDFQFPRADIEECGYNIAMKCQPTFNGVAILSKTPIEDVWSDLVEEEGRKEEARYIEGFTTIDNINLRVASVYVPQGTEIDSPRFQFKLSFYELLKKRFQIHMDNDELLIAGGDYNVAPEAHDVYDPKALEGSLGFHMEERKRFRAILNSGMKDTFRLVHPSTQEYTWWDYRTAGWKRNHGMRLDHILASSSAADHVTEVFVCKKYRALEKPSDHAPVVCRLS